MYFAICWLRAEYKLDTLSQPTHSALWFPSFDTGQLLRQLFVWKGVKKSSCYVDIVTVRTLAVSVHRFRRLWLYFYVSSSLASPRCIFRRFCERLFIVLLLAWGKCWHRLVLVISFHSSKLKQSYMADVAKMSLLVLCVAPSGATSRLLLL